MNPHKWLFTPIDCSVSCIRIGPDVLRRALSLTPEYLRTGQDGSVVNLMEYGVPLGRRFRSLKLWFVMRYFGLEGSTDNHPQSHRLGQELARQIEAARQTRTCRSDSSLVSLLSPQGFR